MHLPLRLNEIGRGEHFSQCFEANYSLHASVAVLQLRYSCLEIEQVELEALEAVAIVRLYWILVNNNGAFGV